MEVVVDLVLRGGRTNVVVLADLARAVPNDDAAGGTVQLLLVGLLNVIRVCRRRRTEPVLVVSVAESDSRERGLVHAERGSGAVLDRQDPEPRVPGVRRLRSSDFGPE